MNKTIKVFSLVILMLIICQTKSFAKEFYVTNTNESGEGSLAQAITDANDLPGLDNVVFNLKGNQEDKYIIDLTNVELPRIDDPIIIDGSTQSGYIDRPIVEIRGGELTLFENSSGSTINNLSITSSDSGISIVGSSNNKIQGNYIGLETDGITARSNSGGISFWSYEDSSPGINNLIGGEDISERNIISGNLSDGIYINDWYHQNSIINNFIGTDYTGGQAVPNKNGINIPLLSSDNFISGNLISGNEEAGIHMLMSVENVITKNIIGLDYSQSYRLPNGTGIFLGGTIAERNELIGFGTQEIFPLEGKHIIGGENPEDANIIAGNDSFGIVIVSDSNIIKNNFIGTNTQGSYDLYNLKGDFGIRSDCNIQRNIMTANTMVMPKSNSGTTLICDISKTNEYKDNTVTYLFEDVTLDNNFRTYIYKLKDQGHISGYSDYKFHPMDQVSRAAFAKFVVNSLGISNDGLEKTPDFKDVDSTNNFYSYIQTLKDTGIVQGRSDGNYLPNDPITRAEAAKIITLAIEYKTGEKINITNPIQFSDVAEGGTFTESINKITSLNIEDDVNVENTKIMSGYSNGNFGTSDFLTREQVSKVVYLAGKFSNRA